jgi:GNAT superfamily N-acetyltransferase
LTAVDADESILGFFTLSPLSLRLDQLSVALPSLVGAVYPQIGGYLLGRMGVHAARQGSGIGAAMVASAEAIAQQSRTGGVFLAVDPKDDDLVGYHVKFGFERLAPHGPRRRMIRSLR